MKIMAASVEDHNFLVFINTNSLEITPPYIVEQKTVAQVRQCIISAYVAYFGVDCFHFLELFPCFYLRLHL
jgi:hypothetical protein